VVGGEPEEMKEVTSKSAKVGEDEGEKSTVLSQGVVLDVLVTLDLLHFSRAANDEVPGVELPPEGGVGCRPHDGRTHGDIEVEEGGSSRGGWFTS